MAISAVLKAFARRGQFPVSSPAYESVFRTVNTSWNHSLLGKSFTSLGSRAFCSKPDHSDPVGQNQAKKLPESNLTKVVFEYDSQLTSRPFEPLARKVLEIPGGRTFFELKRGGDVARYYDLSELELSTGIRVSTIHIIYPSLFKEHLRSIVDYVLDVSDVDCIIDHIDKREDSLLNRKHPGTGCGLRWNLDELFAIRIWEKLTSGDKNVLETIVCELKRNGFDLTEDPVALQKVEEAVERATARRTNMIKLNLPVPVGEPDISTTISWGNYAGLPMLETLDYPPNTFRVKLAQ
ncbi:hypothetical protein MKW94_020932 [Papaver nudicaule]|uniref:Uncharacterized protein n=1 Tax=Papaver nudicaule TaxID=74823 RepID=A0AA41SH34_PAPNU|nr:hypothetical protein [Papaver nudicaule]